MDREIRAWAVSGLGLETRADKAPMLRGHAALFDTLSEDLGGFREKIARGAFAEAVGRDDVRFLVNHEGLPLARTASKTLRLAEDARGLAFEADLDPADPDVARLMPKIARGDLTQMSFAFHVMPDGQDWGQDTDGTVVRTVKKVRLSDVSVVTFPAYTATDVARRSLDDWRKIHARPSAPLNLLRALQAQASI
ncbi:MAG: HK97 family phage prohead protease [Magnetospirillum sp.]|nr:HK97 family phage prohead protease [Magnetospirillum sp.]